MATVAIGSTFPTELTSTGISFCETFATTTGTALDEGGGAVRAAQPAREAKMEVIENAAMKVFEEFINLKNEC